MPEPKVISVILNTNRRADTLECLESLAAGTYGNHTALVLDNHSTDGTTDTLRGLAAKNNRLVHIVPSRNDLGIGGCWDEAINSPQCGRYAVQLDSDDIYSSTDVLTRIIAEFRRGGCAAATASPP